MKQSNIFTILVNSSDGFEDCWIPFFTLLKKYWPNCDAPIILNTERKSFTFPGLNIISTRVNTGIEKNLTWSECLIEALNKIETPLVLYLQEDYFFEKTVKDYLIEDFAKQMIANSLIKYIGLTNYGNSPPFKEWTLDQRFYEVSHSSKYIVSTQAALWNKQTFLSYLRPNENGWMFEIFGSQRAKKGKDLFLTVNRETYNEINPIIYYQLTGIIKGKWLSTIPELFRREGIETDFAKRGFYKEKNRILRKIETARMLIKDPKKLICGILGY